MKAKSTFTIGDRVSVINDTLVGKITNIDQGLIHVECQDGFLYSFTENEIVHNKEWNTLIKNGTKELPRKPLDKGKNKFRSKKGNMIKEIDLHLHELVASEKGMSNFDKLSLQLSTARKELESAISNKHQKIIFIHGIGEGILKSELQLLFKKYPVSFQDASYTEYGLGATEVRIFQNKK